MIGTLRASPEEMAAAASELTVYVKQMSNCFEQMKKTMDNTGVYWSGQAADAHRALYTEQIPQMEEFIARCNEHIRDLNTMAGVYVNAELTAQTKAEELPASVL